MWRKISEATGETRTARNTSMAPLFGDDKHTAILELLARMDVGSRGSSWRSAWDRKSQEEGRSVRTEKGCARTREDHRRAKAGWGRRRRKVPRQRRGVEARATMQRVSFVPFYGGEQVVGGEASSADHGQEARVVNLSHGRMQ
jgi:hypothetical protein